MKKSLFFLTAIMLLIPLMTFGQDYWIEGFYERHGAGNYTLKDVHTQGIYLDGQTSLQNALPGSKEHIICDGVDATMVQFRFEKATTDCPSKWTNGFYFQYWDEDNYKWKTDVEACKGESTGYSKKHMVMMLVLDYSFSMKDNISRLQSSAINFINTISNVSNGNVHIGIIAFSGMDLAENQYFPITPIDNNNKSRFINFIRNSSKGKETALYFAMDKALKMMENYVAENDFPEDNFNGTCMITFTDGLDNASINDDISVSMHRGRKNEYLAYISSQLKGSSRKYIKGLPVENFEIGFTGSEDFTQEDRDFFRDVLMQTTPDEKHLKLATRFEEVEEYFRYIARQLTERWETINMYVGESQYGKVRWVLNCSDPVDIPEPKPEPKGKRSPWFGVSVEAGILEHFFAGLNLDMAFSISNSFALGARIGAFYGSYEESHSYSYYDYYWGYTYNTYTESKSTIGFLIGPDFKFTFPNDAAIIAGLGYGSVNNQGAVYVRAGYKTKKSFFVTAETLVGDFVGAGVGIGFSFGGKPRN